MKRIILSIILTVLPIVFSTNELFAKNNGKKSNSVFVSYEVQFIDEYGKPIPFVEISFLDRNNFYLSDEDGRAAFKAKSDDIVFFEAAGYERRFVNLKKEYLANRIQMSKIDIYNSEFLRGDGGYSSADALLSSINIVTGDKIASHPDVSTMKSMQGKLPGVVVVPVLSGLQNGSVNLNVRGLHRKGYNNAIILVDGIERSGYDVLQEDIESIQVIKDITGKILYGPRAANGVINIITKKGSLGRNEMKASVESGIMHTINMPEYINSYDYATLYNEARLNDGLLPKYSNEQLLGYKNSTGPNDLLYPDVDYYDYFLRKNGVYNKVVFSANGGDEIIKYHLSSNYLGSRGFEKVGATPSLDRFGINGNIIVDVTDFLSVYVSANTKMEINKWGRSTFATQVFQSLSSTRPNEYPLIISPDVINLEPNEDGVPFFGASNKSSNNLLAEIAYGGTSEDRYIRSQLNLGLNLNLNKYVKGLSAKAVIFYDNYNYFRQGQSKVYPTYFVSKDKEGNISFVQMRKQSIQTSQYRASHSEYGTLGLSSNVQYENQWRRNAFETVLAFDYYDADSLGEAQDIQNTNTTLRLNYSYDKRYLAEIDLALMGSNRFDRNSRFFLSKAVSLGWIVSNESFWSNNGVVDFLKLRADAGVMGYDACISHLLDKTVWQCGSMVPFGELNKNQYYTVNFLREGNPNLKWETSTEFDLGIETSLFDNSLNVDFSWFYEDRNNIIGIDSANSSSLVGDFVRSDNLGRVQNSGIDMSIGYQNKISDFSYSITLNYLWSRAILKDWSEPVYPDTNIKSIGKPVDVILGYKSLGIYGKDIQYEPGKQMLGEYGIGDLAYLDYNEDGIVDMRDQMAIGNSFPRSALTLEVDLNYKNWSLYLTGISYLGYDYKKMNSFYNPKAEGKYSVIALDRYHPDNNPDGSYPMLTTTNGDNNYVCSSFWVDNSSFFRLKNAEVRYRFDLRKSKSGIDNIQLFVRGTNLLTISKEKYLDIEMLDAGISNYPNYMTVTGGISITL